MSLPVLILVWLGGNAILALAGVVLCWMCRRGTPSEAVWIYQPGLEDDYINRVIAEAFFAVPEFMARVREEER